MAKAAISDVQLLEEGIDELGDVFHGARKLLMDGTLSPCYVQYLVRETAEASVKKHKATNKKKMVYDLTHLGLMTLQLMVDVSKERLGDQWEEIALAAAWCVRMWRPEVFSPEPATTVTERTKWWVLRAMSSEISCPDPLLRLALLRFAAMWDVKDLMNPSLGRLAASGFLENVLFLKVSHLLLEEDRGLLCSLRKFLYNLHFTYRLEPLIDRSCQQIHEMQLGKEVMAFANLMVLMGEAARTLQGMPRKDSSSMLKKIQEFSNIVKILHLLTGLVPNRALYEMPGMRQLAVDAIATTLRSIVLTPVEPQSYSYRKLLSEVDVYILFLQSFTGMLLDDLRWHHGSLLTLLSQRMQDYFWHPVFVPEPLPKKRLFVSERFKDSKTKRLMTLPVRLEVTGHVVDYSTLLRLVLLQNQETFKDSQLVDLTYTPLHYLRNEIHAWNLTSGFGRGGSCSS